MAKKKVVAKKEVAAKAAPSKKVNKAEAIRVYAKANPNAGPKAIVEALGGKGIKVTPPQVSNTLSSAKKKTTKRKTKTLSTAKLSVGSVVLQDLVEAKKFADNVGGVDEAKSLLTALGKLTD